MFCNPKLRRTVNYPIRFSFLAALLLGLSPWVHASVVVSRLQSPQVIDGPNNRSDTPSRAFWNGSEFSMYVANSYIYNMRGADTRSVSEAWDFYADDSASLAPGSAGNVDDNGGWILHAEVATENTNLVRGWYHAEQVRPGLIRKSMAYCESHDGGRTFQKVCPEDPARNYPNNQFITAWTGYNGNTNADSAGDGRIVKVGKYYYCYFLATDTWRRRDEWHLDGTRFGRAFQFPVSQFGYHLRQRNDLER